MLDGLVERSALRAAVAAWRSAPDAERILLLVGSPGSGKSSFCESLAHSEAPHIDAAHFCRAHDAATTSPLAVVSSLSARLAAALPGFAEELLREPGPRSTIRVDIRTGAVAGQVTGVQVEVLNLGELSLRDALWTALIRPLNALSERASARPVTLLVDGLDEAGDDADNVAGLFAQLSGLPPSVRVVVSSRPEGRIMRALPENSRRTFSLDDDYPAALMTQELGQLVEARLSGADGAARPPAAAVAEVVARAAGNFQFAALLATFAARDPDAWKRGDLPSELNALYSRYLSSLEPDLKIWRRAYGPLLGALSVAQAPLGEIQLADYCRLARSEVRETLDALAPFLRRQANGLTIYHASFSDFLKSESAGVYWRPTEESHAALAGRLRDDGGFDWAAVDEYLLRHGPLHLIAGGCAQAELSAALGAPLYREKLSRQVIGQVLEDYRRYAQALRGGGATWLLWRICWTAFLAREASRTGAATLLAAYVKTGRWTRAVELALALDEESAGYVSERGLALREIARELGALGDASAALETLRLTREPRDGAPAVAERLAQVSPGAAIALLDQVGCRLATAQTCAILARLPEYRADAIRLAGDESENLWAAGMALWPDDPQEAERWIDQRSWRRVLGGQVNGHLVAGLPVLAAAELSITDPVRAFDLLPEPRAYADFYAPQLAMIAARLAPHDRRRANSLLKTLPKGDLSVLVKAHLCAAGAGAAFPRIHEIGPEEEHHKEFFGLLEQRPECLDVIDQVDPAVLIRDPDARRLAAWCLDAVLSWIMSIDEPAFRVDYPYAFLRLVGRWIGLADPDRFAEFEAFVTATSNLDATDALRGFLAGLAEAAGGARTAEWAKSRTSPPDEASLREAVQALARTRPDEVLPFVRAVARSEHLDLALRGAAAGALPASRRAELEALLADLPVYGRSAGYRRFRAMIRAALLGLSGLGPAAGGDDVPEALHDWLAFEAACQKGPAAARIVAGQARDGLVRAELMRRVARGADRAGLQAAAQCARSADADGQLIDGVGWLYRRDILADIVRDLAVLDVDAALQAAAKDPSETAALSAAVEARFAGDARPDPVQLAIELLEASRRDAGDNLMFAMDNWGRSVRVLRAVAARTPDLPRFLDWAAAESPALAHYLRCYASTEDPTVLVAAARERWHMLREGDEDEDPLVRSLLRSALQSALARLAATDFDGAAAIWRGELADDSQASEVLVEIAQAAAASGRGPDRAALARYVPDGWRAELTIEKALRAVVETVGRADPHAALERLAEISDGAFRFYALEELTKVRRGASGRSRAELLTLLDAAEDLASEEHRLRVISECLFDDQAPWDLPLLELCLVRGAEASRDRWHHIIPALARRLARIAPALPHRLEAEMEIVSEIANLAVT